MHIDFSDRKTQVYAAAGATGVLATIVLAKKLKNRGPRKGPLTPDTLPKDAYDAVIVGAGPSGGVCAFYMAKAGAKVALLDKATFPREKICGDAVCTPAIRILEDMGVMDELVKDNQARFADSGGFVSPSGLSYIGNSVHKVGEAVACAIKRINLDDKIVKAAVKAGANLKEGFEVQVEDVTFDEATKLWTVKSAAGEVVKGRVLVCADGSTSRLATQLGYCTAPPQGVSSRAYISNHNTEFDGACFYPRWSLPGYAAIFKHTTGDLGYCYYLIPCGKDAAKGQMGRVWESDLKRLHEEGIKNDPFISRAMGPNPKCERMKAASLRVGGQGLTTTHADHLVIVGDAAGHIDPLTGEGIHTAMMGGKFAAEALLEAREAGDFSSVNTARYEAAWKKRYGHDFFWSQVFAYACYKCPILLDAVANEVQRTGDTMMSEWAMIACNMQSKLSLLRPTVATKLGFALLRELWAQKVAKRPDGYKMPETAQNGKATTNGKA